MSQDIVAASEGREKLLVIRIGNKRNIDVYEDRSLGHRVKIREKRLSRKKKKVSLEETK